MPVRALEKLAIALQHSTLCISARTFREKNLVGFVRATSDGVFNLTLWDLVVAPSLPNRETAMQLMLTRLQREAVKIVPNCAISAFVREADHDLLRRMNFTEDKKGIRAMVLPTAGSADGLS